MRIQHWIFKSKSKLGSLIFLECNVKNNFDASSLLTSTLLFMCIIAKALSRSEFMLDLNHVLNLLIAEKLRSHSADVTGNVQPILIKMKMLGNLSLSQPLMNLGRLSGRSSGLINFLFHRCSS